MNNLRSLSEIASVGGLGLARHFRRWQNGPIALLLRLKEPQADLRLYGSITALMNTSYKSLCFFDFMAIHAPQEACLAALTARRWPAGFVCPHCAHSGGYTLGGRRGCECGSCHRQTSVTSGTALGFTKLPLPKVFIAMYLIAALLLLGVCR